MRTVCAAHRPLAQTVATIVSTAASSGLWMSTRAAATRTPAARPPLSQPSPPAQGRAVGENEGLFQSIHLNNFPVRAAIDIGTGGVVSLCVARVDAAHHSIVKMLYQTQLPLFLEMQSPPPASTASSSSSSPQAFMISEKSLTDIRNKLRVLHGAMRRDACEGLSERAAVIAWPLCEAMNAPQLAAELTREFQLDVRVLGRTFQTEWPFADLVASTSTTSGTNTRTETTAPSTPSRPRRPAGDQTSLKALVRAAKEQRLERRRQASQEEAPRPSSSSQQQQQQKEEDDEATSAVPAKAQVERLAFLAHASVAQCVAAQRMLIITEDPQKGLVLVGTDTPAELEAQDLLQAATSPEEIQAILGKLSAASSDDDSAASPASVTSTSTSTSPFPASRVAGKETGDSSSLLVRSMDVNVTALLEHRLPIDVAEAHRLCVTRVQHRSPDTYGLHTSSPNPLLTKEFDALVNMMTPMLAATLPAWVQRKSALGGVIAGTSFNGGVLNVAARVSQKTSISLDHLEVHARHHFCGLTDVLLASNFPNPLLVMPSAALACALMRALETPRVTYVPELSTACALITQPQLWSYDRRDAIRAERAQQPFYASAQHRTFHRPHRKDNPSAAPGATDRA